MAKIAFRLENSWHKSKDDPNGGFVFTLVNLSDETITDFKLAYTSLTRVIDRSKCTNATFLHRNANFHQYAPPAGFELKPGGTWRFTVDGLNRPARHRTDGAKSAILTLADGSHVTVAVDDLVLEGAPSQPAPALLPEGRVTEPFYMLPWPADASLTPGDGFPDALYPAEGSGLDDLRAVDKVNQLSRRLFSVGHVPFSLTPIENGRAIGFNHDTSLASDAYTLEFTADRVTLAYGADSGRQYALTLLAQLLQGARSNTGCASPCPAPSRTPRATAGAAAILMSPASSIPCPTSSGSSISWPGCA